MVRTETIDLGNNESMTRGVFEQPDGTFLALAYSTSKSGFRTRGGAERWLERRTNEKPLQLGEQANGSFLGEVKRSDGRTVVVCIPGR